MLRFVGAFTLVLATALAAPQLNIPQQGQQGQQAQAYQATAYQTQSGSQGQVGDGSQATPVPIISFDDSQPGDGTFKYSYETGNGIKLEGSGFTKKATVPQFDETGARTGDAEEDVLVQVGSYSYTAPDGQLISVKYIADENGFQPQGDHLPTPPSVPEAIVNSLSQQANSQGQQQQPQQQQRFAQQQQQPQAQQRSAPQQQQQQQAIGGAAAAGQPGTVPLDTRSNFAGAAAGQPGQPGAAASNNQPFQVILP